MTKQEALAFLELDDTATGAEIKTRLAERMAHYETLSEKAPSDFLRRLNLRNFDKVKAIVSESAQWPSFIADEPVQQDNGPEEIMEEVPLTVYIVSSVKDAVLKEAEKKEMARKRPTDEPAGWLIRHTENQETKTYALQTGKNFVGRKQQAGMQPFIVIEGDEFISRVQCVIYAEEENPLEFYISDPSYFNKGKSSKNGTYINSSSTVVTEKVKLTDEDTIQLGITKFVLRFNTGDIKKIIQEVEQSKYMDSVVLDAS
jgi:FHA domain